MNIFVTNAASGTDGTLGKFLSALNGKKFSCSLKVYPGCMQIVAKKLYASKIKIFTVGKNLTKKLKNVVIFAGKMYVMTK